MDILRRAITHAVVPAALFLTWGPPATAQISPGDLSAPHASLEGMGNCTKCHALGKEVSNDNCLACHTELRARVTAGRGFHGKLTGKPCAGCHNEHHGRGFTLVRFDQKNFNHDETGYVLEGKHRPLECVRCHTQSHITAKDVRANKSLLDAHTYLGLGTDCS